MDNNYSTMLTAIAEAGNDDLFARFTLGVAVWNDEKRSGQKRSETLEKIKSDAPRLAAKTFSTSASISQLLKVVGHFASYDAMIKAIDKAGMSFCFASALKLATGEKKARTPKAFDAAKRAAVVGADLTDDQRKALAAALLAL